jgi:hypothetical protein
LGGGVEALLQQICPHQDEDERKGMHLLHEYDEVLEGTEG